MLRKRCQWVGNHGSSREAPLISMSDVFRVTIIKSFAIPVAAIMPSMPAWLCLLILTEPGFYPRWLLSVDQN
ncbi:MAG: hypothetical protein KJ550_05770 [Proteobacteria bacterium]|nr:hypothetical protein [Pseudomonadota bacterium]MBU4066970.1 hypothetical protein [Pseudomonadota bacterium]MBU4100440.1 hypothetical protein [Pseudomonadota bacterium]MBU4127312.1 hypothetical protein [Pseudomonadota bacterium]MCG2759487.1 hypothetical protein [Desulfobacteraceae bacterium]